MINLSRASTSRRSGPPATASARCWRMWWPTPTAGLTSPTSRYREHAVGLPVGVHSQHRAGAARRAAAQRRHADLRRVRRDAADREAHAGTGDVSLPVRLHGAGGGHRERLGAEPVATFSTCFGAPFLPRGPEVYGRMLGRPDRAARRRLLAGQHRLERRAVRRRPAHEHPPYPRPAAAPRSTARWRARGSARSGSSAWPSPSTCPVCRPRCSIRASPGRTRRPTTAWRTNWSGGSRRTLPRSRPASATRSVPRRSARRPEARSRHLARAVGGRCRVRAPSAPPPIIRTSPLPPSGDPRVCTSRPLFKEDRIDVLHEAIRRAGLATLVTLTADGLIASHMPMLLDPDPAPYGTLLGHVARPNPQARGATPGVAGPGDLPGPRCLHHPLLVSDQAREREGRADLELRRDPRIRAHRVLPRYRPSPRYRHPPHGTPGDDRARNPGPSPTLRRTSSIPC